jgi:hypothetical protein
MEPDYPASNVWNLLAEPLEELDDFEDLVMWGSLEENLENSDDEDYE